MADSNRAVIIVDGYSAGNLLAPEFRTRGFRTVHVQSTQEIWKVLLPTFRPEDYDQNFAFDGNLEELIAKLKPMNPIGVVPGTETGVELADTLSAKLAIKSNGVKKSAARRNKYDMVEAVRSAGLRAAKQFKSGNAKEIVDWFKKEKLAKVVVKPLNSAGTDNVAVCTTTDQVERAVGAIVGKTNMLGLTNGEALIQEFLEGTEHFLNTVSLDGHHHFTEIWKYKKRSINGHDCVYDRNELLPSFGEEELAMQDYVVGVLNALDVRYGPAHTEVMMGPNGPALVEVGTRLDGLSVPAVNIACVGYGPLDLTADVYGNEPEYMRKSKSPYKLRKHAYTVYLTSYQQGEVLSIPGEDRIKNLRSFFQMRLRVKPGSPIKKTTDYFTAPGFFTLVHESKAALEEDYQFVRAMEERGEVFTVKE